MLTFLRPWLLIFLMLPVAFIPSGLTLGWCSCEGMSSDCCVDDSCCDSELEAQRDSCCLAGDQPQAERGCLEEDPDGDCSCCHTLDVESVKDSVVPEASITKIELKAVMLDVCHRFDPILRSAKLLPRPPPADVRPVGLRPGIAPLRI